MQINSAKNKQKLLDGWGAEYGHEIIELMMLENNLIPSLRFFSNKARLIKILKLIKLFRFEFNYSYDKYHQGYFIFISKSKPQAFLLKNNANSNKTAGKLLGFPACCIKAHFQSKALNSGT
ncbi:MAG: hypothetical protein NT116_01290, partial [Candidatus Parcubacteria bacterium]|nr:hypothetical protein [Candidatus Parcubacteria bacterium]